MALLQYFRSVPREHLPLPGQSLHVVSAKGLIFRETTVARKFNPRISTVIQPKRPPWKFSPAKITRYTVCGSLTVKFNCVSAVLAWKLVSQLPGVHVEIVLSTQGWQTICIVLSWRPPESYHACQECATFASCSYVGTYEYTYRRCP